MMSDPQLLTTSRLISIAERLLTIRLQHNLDNRGIDLTVEQWRTLFYLWLEDGINQQELSTRAVKEKSTMTRLINSLVKKGLIERRCLDSDKRNKLIFLTEEGKAIQDDALSTGNRITKRSENKISDEELQSFKNTISKMIENLS